MNYILKSFLSILLVTFFLNLNSANAAPNLFKGYCMIVQEGNSPGLNMVLPKGKSVEILKKESLSYQVFYGDFLQQKNLLQLKIVDEISGKQSVANVYIDEEFPSSFELSSDQGIIACWKNK